MIKAMTVGTAALVLAGGCSGRDATVLAEGPSAAPVTDIAPGAVPGAPEGMVFTPFEEYRDGAEVEIDGKTVYRVEWDLVFETEQQLLEHYLTEVARLSQRWGSGAVEKSVVMMDDDGNRLQFERGPDALDITYCIDAPSFSNLSQIEADVAEATHDWERVANVRFFYDPSKNGNCDDATSGVDVAITDDSTGGGANGCPPFIGTEFCTPGKLTIDYTVWPWPWTDLRTRVEGVITDFHPNLTLVGILRHELGHILGLRHEHPFDPAGPDFNCGETPIMQCTAVPGCTSSLHGEELTEYDVESVMHYPFCGGGNMDTAFELTNFDGVGVRHLYGMPVAWNQPLVSLL